MFKYLETLLNFLLDFLKTIHFFNKEKIINYSKNNLDNVLFIISIMLGFILGYLLKKNY